MWTKLLAQRLAVVADHRDALALLALEAGDADHEEFVEVVGGDRQEAQALEDRMIGVAGLLEHAAVEMEPRQLAIDEAFRPLAETRADRHVERRDGCFA